MILYGVHSEFLLRDGFTLVEIGWTVWNFNILKYSVAVYYMNYVSKQRALIICIYLCQAGSRWNSKVSIYKGVLHQPNLLVHQIIESLHMQYQHGRPGKYKTQKRCKHRLCHQNESVVVEKQGRFPCPNPTSRGTNRGRTLGYLFVTSF